MDVKFIKCFFCIYWDDHKILILYFAMWCIKLTDLQMLNHPCIPTIDPIWSRYMILLMYCWIWFAVEEFCIYIHQGYWLVIFLSCGFLVWFWYQGNAGLVKMSFEEFPSLLIWGKFQNNRYQLFFEYLVEFTSEASGPGCWNVLLVGMFLITDSISLLVISLHIFYFILIQSL